MFEVKVTRGCGQSRQRGVTVDHDGIFDFIEDRATTFTQPQTGFQAWPSPAILPEHLVPGQWLKHVLVVELGVVYYTSWLLDSRATPDSPPHYQDAPPRFPRLESRAYRLSRTHKGPCQSLSNGESRREIGGDADSGCNSGIGGAQRNVSLC